MEIDFSAASSFRTCPLKYYEQYIRGIEPKPRPGETTPLTLGSRVHELLEVYYNELAQRPIPWYAPTNNAALELEADIIMTGYRAKYPQEDFEIVDIERTFRVTLPSGRHTYTGKIDLTFRVNGVLNIMDHKTQGRKANTNHPKKWAAKDQATLYLWAASKVYKEEIGQFHVNVIARPSEKLQEGPIFPDRQILERTPEQIKIALRDLEVTADDIERYKVQFADDLWPANREKCSEGWYDCEFYQLHTYGYSDELLEHKFQPKQEYLHLGGVQIIQ